MYVRTYVLCMRAFGLRIVKVLKYRTRNKCTMEAQKQFLTHKKSINIKSSCVICVCVCVCLRVSTLLTLIPM